MEKKYLRKFEEIAEKLRTADDKTAYRILDRMQTGMFLIKAARSLVKKDFSLDKGEAIILLGHAIPSQECNLNIDHRRGFYCNCWCNSKNKNEKISLVLDCSNLKKVVMQIAITRGKGTNALIFDDKVLVAPPAELKAIVGNLEGFSEKKPGLWTRPLGEAKNLVQAKRLIKPVWDSVYNVIKPFGDQW